MPSSPGFDTPRTRGSSSTNPGFVREGLIFNDFPLMKWLKNLSFGLVVLLISVLAVATCLEKAQGTSFVTAHIYGSPWFVALWAVLAAVGLAYLSCRRLRASVWLLHGAFVLILAGALVTRLFGLQGSVHLRQDASESVSVFTDADG